jgi:acetyl esterase/lipase
MAGMMFLLAGSIAQAQPAANKVHRDVEYVKGGHERQKLDLYLPEKADAALPVIVWVHGGAWRGGSKNGCPATAFVGRGYAVASINYRLSQHAPFPAQIEDCKTAIRWLRAHAREYNLDGNRIGVWGGSAGGHLVALLGTTADIKELEGNGGHPDQSSRVQCVCNFFGPTDFLLMAKDSKDPGNPLAQLIGGPVVDNKLKAIKASPITYVTKDDAPILILHGDQDRLVPIGQSEVFAKALKGAGVEVTFKEVKGAGHGGTAFSSAESRKLISDFFDRHLKK